MVYIHVCNSVTLTRKNMKGHNKAVVAHFTLLMHHASPLPVQQILFSFCHKAARHVQIVPFLAMHCN